MCIFIICFIFQNTNKHLPLHHSTGILLRLLRLRGCEHPRRRQTLFLRYECPLVPSAVTLAHGASKLGEKFEISDSCLAICFHSNLQWIDHYFFLYVTRIAKYHYSKSLFVLVPVASLLWNCYLCLRRYWSGKYL